MLGGKVGDKPMSVGVRSPSHILATIAVVLFIGALLMFGIKITRSAPIDAPLIVDSERKTYASVPCVLNGTLDRELIKNRRDVNAPTKPLVLMDYAEESTIGEVRRLKSWHPDVTCRNAAGFTQTISLAGSLLGWERRWTRKGQWRW